MVEEHRCNAHCIVGVQRKNRKSVVEEGGLQLPIGCAYYFIWTKIKTDETIITFWPLH